MHHPGPLPAKQRIPSDDAALIVEIAASHGSALFEDGLEGELLRLSTDALEVFKLMNLQAAATVMQSTTQGPAAAAHGRISNLLLNRLITRKAAAEPQNSSRPPENSGDFCHRPDSEKKEHYGINSAMAFVPSDDDVENAVDSSGHRGTGVSHIAIMTSVVLAATATFYLLWMYL